MTFGEKLKFLRKQKGFSQERLSQQLTVSRQAISKWELGESLPDTENVIQLSKLFSVSIDFLLNDNICSEADIPAVQHNTTVLQDKFRSKILLEATVLGGWTWNINANCKKPDRKSTRLNSSHRSLSRMPSSA